MHRECLERWRSISSNQRSYYRCDQCHYEYNMARIRAAGCIATLGVAESLTFLVMCICVLLCMVPSCLVLKVGFTSPYCLLAGAGLFGLLGFFAVCCVEGQEGRECCGLLRHLLRDFPVGQVDGPVGKIILILIGSAVLVMAVMGLVLAPCAIYRRVLRLSRAGLQALETYVLDIRDADPLLAPVGAAQDESPPPVGTGSGCSLQASRDGREVRESPSVLGSRARARTPTPARLPSPPP